MMLEAEMPPAPAIYVEYTRCQRYHALPWAGGLEDQPFMRMFEMDCVADAIAAWETRQAKTASKTDKNRTRLH